VAEPLALQVTMAGDRGGAEAIIETLVDHLGTEGYRTAVAAPVGTPLAERWSGRGWPVLPLPPMPKFRDWRAGRIVSAHIAEAIRASGASVVHTHDRFHAAWTVEGLLHRLAARERHDVVIAISRMVAESLAGWVPTRQIMTVMNGVDPVRVPPVRREVPEAPLVVWCGRLQRWKGAHLFLEAAATIRAQVPDARFAVVGGTLFGLDQDYPATLRAQVSASGLSEAVHWAGHVADARSWLAAADVVVHSAVDPEPFGLVVAEAMMQSVPVVAFAQGGPAEMIVDGVTGALVPVGDTEAMARAVVAWLTDRDARAAAGQAARTHALAHFGAATMVRGVKTAYDRARGIV
jgi:glycosyltransferase involved in cell wall biosynthesis